jgi:3-oxoacyl-[acyl-carrier-protein] synthase-3
MVNNACITHSLLGLPRRCFALGTDGACNGFAMHVSLAQALIASKQARYVLSVHSSAITRVHGPTEPHSAWWGDGAAAAVIGPVSDGHGLVAAVHNASGESCRALVLGVPDRHWWEPGACTTHSVDRDHTRLMLMTLVDRARDTIVEALDKAGRTPGDVDFYASHQGTAWFTQATAAHTGLERAGSLSTFSELANMNSVNVPLILARGVESGMIRDGSVVATFSGGLGETWSSLVFRWGA